MQENTKRNILLCAAAKGSFWTRLSFFIMGTGCIRYKQYVRGLIYLLTQIGFFCFLKNFALQYLSKFFTLGTETQRKVWNEDLQIYQRFPGDNSMLILLYSVLSLAVIAVFLYIWYANIRDSWHAQENLREGRKIASFRDDLHSLTNERFHITFHHAALYVLRDGPRDDHYLRDEFQQLQRHIPAHCRRPLLAGLLSGR